MTLLNGDAPATPVAPKGDALAPAWGAARWGGVLFCRWGVGFARFRILRVSSRAFQNGSYTMV